MTENGRTPERSTLSAAMGRTVPRGKGLWWGGRFGRDATLASVHWTVAEARLRGVGVHLVMAWQQPQSYGAANDLVLGMDPSGDTGAILADAARTELARLGTKAGAGRQAAITGKAVEGHPAEVLVHASQEAAMLVVRGHGGFVGALLGSGEPACGGPRPLPGGCHPRFRAGKDPAMTTTPGEGRRTAGRAGPADPVSAGSFGQVIGVDRAGQSQALLDHGADIVVADLMDVVGRR